MPFFLKKIVCNTASLDSLSGLSSLNLEVTGIKLSFHTFSCFYPLHKYLNPHMLAFASKVGTSYYFVFISNLFFLTIVNTLRRQLE